MQKGKKKATIKYDGQIFTGESPRKCDGARVTKYMQSQNAFSNESAGNEHNATILPVNLHA